MTTVMIAKHFKAIIMKMLEYFSQIKYQYNTSIGILSIINIISIDTLWQCLRELPVACGVRPQLRLRSAHHVALATIR